MSLSLSNSIDANTTADAVEVQQNFGEITSHINSEVIHRDGSVAMQQHLVMLGGDPVSANQAVNKGYVDAKDADLLPKAGGTVTGQIKGITPVAAEDLTTKAYVDAADTANTTAITSGDALKVNKAGDTMTGSLTVGTTGSATLVQVGGNAAGEQAGVQLRGDGAISSRLEDPSGVSSHNISLERAGAFAADPLGIYVGMYRSVGTSGGVVNVGSIRISAGASGVDYNTTSDYRLKDDLGPVTDAVERLGELLPKRIRWKANGHEEDGFLAHEVAEVVPNAVTGAKDAVTSSGEIDAQQFSPTALIPLLVAAVQQLTARVAELEAV